VNTKQIDEILARFEKYGEYEVGQLCRIVEGFEIYEPSVIAFIDAGVADTVIKSLPLLEDIHTSFVFMNLWTAVCSQQNEQCSTNDVISLILDPTMTRSFKMNTCY